jgi:hypothetical protein
MQQCSMQFLKKPKKQPEGPAWYLQHALLFNCMYGIRHSVYYEYHAVRWMPLKRFLCKTLWFRNILYKVFSSQLDALLVFSFLWSDRWIGTDQGMQANKGDDATSLCKLALNTFLYCTSCNCSCMHACMHAVHNFFSRSIFTATSS